MYWLTMTPRTRPILRRRRHVFEKQTARYRGGATAEDQMGYHQCLEATQEASDTVRSSYLRLQCTPIMLTLL